LKKDHSHGDEWYRLEAQRLTVVHKIDASLFTHEARAKNAVQGLTIFDPPNKQGIKLR